MLCSLIAGVCASASPVYHLVDLGPGMRPEGLNNSGILVGTYTDASGVRRAFRWEAGMFSLLDPGSAIFDLNDAGVVAGLTEDGSGETVATLWTNGSLQLIGGPGSAAMAVDAAGQAAGSAGGSASLFPKSLGVGGVWSGAYGLNSQGVVIGTVQMPDGTFRAFRYRPEAGPMLLPTLGGLSSYGIGINALGEIIGNATTASGYLRAFLWRAGLMTDLGTLGGSSSSVGAINSFGSVVGSSIASDGEFSAFLWINGFLFDLNSLLGNGLGWRLIEATAINDRGQIAGVGLFDGERRGFLLDPVFAAEEVPVRHNPEPSTMALMAIGVVLIGVGARHRSR